MTLAPPSGTDEGAGGTATPGTPVPRVRVRGRVETAHELDDLALVGLADERRECRYLCASGRRWGGRWRGVPLSAVVERVGVDPDATHVVARGRTGHAACLPLAAALDGLLAVERDGSPLAPTRRPRLVAPGVDAARTVKGVRALDFRRLAPGEDPEDHERLGYDGDGGARFPADENGRERSMSDPSNREVR